MAFCVRSTSKLAKCGIDTFGSFVQWTKSVYMTNVIVTRRKRKGEREREREKNQLNFDDTWLFTQLVGLWWVFSTEHGTRAIQTITIYLFHCQLIMCQWNIIDDVSIGINWLNWLQCICVCVKERVCWCAVWWFWFVGVSDQIFLCRLEYFWLHRNSKHCMNILISSQRRPE